jgi:hypothetical protein
MGLFDFFLLNHIFGYEVLILNVMLKGFNARGYVFIESSGSLHDLNTGQTYWDAYQNWSNFFVFRFEVIVTVVFILFSLSSVVGFVLRESQRRMHKFSVLLHQRIQARHSYSELIVPYLTKSLVFVPIMLGLMFLSFEVYGNAAVAFCQLSVVWLAEVFAAVSLRTRISLRYFPPIFCLYFCAFNVYFFSCPFPHAYLALAACSLLMIHAALVCWWRFEIPALSSRDVRLVHPRQMHPFT